MAAGNQESDMGKCPRLVLRGRQSARPPLPPATPRRPRAAAGPHRPFSEPLEGRLLLSTYTVTNLADSGPGSLRQGIAAVAGPDRLIQFAGTLRGTIGL